MHTIQVCIVYFNSKDPLALSPYKRSIWVDTHIPVAKQMLFETPHVKLCANETNAFLGIEEMITSIFTAWILGIKIVY